MKDPNDMTTAGLVLRLVALKAQKKIIDVRRAVLRDELMGRLEKGIPIVIAGFRVIKRWQVETTHWSKTAAHWELRINKAKPGCRQERI